jgi:hypothetical protein
MSPTKEIPLLGWEPEPIGIAVRADPTLGARRQKQPTTTITAFTNLISTILR